MTFHPYSATSSSGGGLGLQFLTGGGTITASTVASAQSANFQGIYLDPNYVWDMSGLVLNGVQNFTIESRMAGGIGFSNTVQFNATGYITTSTGSPADGVQIYGGTQPCNNLTLRGLVFSGSNTTATVHLGGRIRRLLMERCLVQNTNSTVGAYGLINDTALQNANSEDNCFLECDFAGAYAGLGIGISDGSSHCNDSSWINVSTSGVVYGLVITAGGNHTLLNYYDRSNPSTATVWNHGGQLTFYAGENGNNSSGVTYINDASGSTTSFEDCTFTATTSNILNISNGNVIVKGRTRTNGACVFNLTGGNLDLASPDGDLANLTVSGSGGALLLANQQNGGSGHAATVSWSGTPTYQASSIVASLRTNNANTTQTLTWTPPALNTRFRVSVWIQVTTAGTSTVPVLAFAQFAGTSFSQTLPMWLYNSAAAAPTYTLAATGTYAATFESVTDTSATAITLTTTPTGSTFKIDAIIERLA